MGHDSDAGQSHRTTRKRRQAIIRLQHTSGLPHGAHVLQGESLFEGIVVDENIRLDRTDPPGPN